MHDLFVNAAFAEPPKCLGVQLKPFSLAHVHVLMAFGSPYVTKGTPTLSDFVTAVWVCSHDCYPFAGIADAVRSDKIEKQAKRWGRRTKAAQFTRDGATFAEYVATGLKMPPRNVDPAKTRMARVPWSVAAACALMRNGIPREDAWTMPLAEAVMYRLTFDYIDGDDSLQSEAEREAGFVTVRKREVKGEDDGR